MGSDPGVVGKKSALDVRHSLRLLRRVVILLAILLVMSIEKVDDGTSTTSSTVATPSTDEYQCDHSNSDEQHYAGGGDSWLDLRPRVTRACVRRGKSRTDEPSP